MEGYLKDSKGEKCGRRLFGLVITVMGLTLGLILFFAGLVRPYLDFNCSFSVFVSMLTAGSSLLGLNIIDSIKDSIMSKK